MNNYQNDNSDLNLCNTNYDVFLANTIYVNYFRMYYAYYNSIPNFKSINYISIELFRKWFEKEYKNQIIKEHYKQKFDSQTKKLINVDQFYFLHNGIMLNVEQDHIYMLFSTKQETEANELFEKFKLFIKTPKRTTDISVIVSQYGGLETKEVHVKKPKIDFNIHYNEDFFNIHKSIVKQLNQKDINGLYLFHGQPGTGKSTYIKYLIHQLKKKVIFLSPKMAGELDNVNMTTFLLENRNTVLVIEDAEELISSREEVRNSSLSMLLNLTDGLLGESFGIQIIATFNTDIKNIDKALLRKGRLSKIYEFKPIALERTNALLHKLGHNAEVKSPMAVSDIYNFEINTNYQPILKKAVGFGN
jgi:ATP-dependent 26S proteasome regulatory subunit